MPEFFNQLMKKVCEWNLIVSLFRVAKIPEILEKPKNNMAKKPDI